MLPARRSHVEWLPHDKPPEDAEITGSRARLAAPPAGIIMIPIYTSMKNNKDSAHENIVLPVTDPARP